ncbi:GlxA family transcriptional regulator [Methylobacterium sp. WSM2598]|uniref:GlxA family transcriptional regulator n=1 Tax=Methylobacterium sp. WSM2598 TaxID=398261 RepID=UPI0005697D8D|nr:helix-turn-helix domain-containing protein [Methylobacterium sp. WSM2598]
MPIPRRRVEILAFPDVQLLDVAGPLQVFASTNDEAGPDRPYDPVVVAREPCVTASAGLGLVAAPLPRADAPLDTLVVAGGRGVEAVSRDPAMLAFVRQRAAAAARTASVCTGAFVLAAAGLLDGRRAVTHWDHCGLFAERFPRVRLDPDPIFVRDGAVWTSAGVTAGIDLALAMVEEDLGRAAALAVARRLVVFLKRPGGQAQFSTVLALQAEPGRFDGLHAWIAGHLRGDLSLPVLAARAGMSARSFSRHYRQATGRTPARAVEAIRVEAARRLLEQGAPVARAAARCGFGSEETMRRGFLRVLGTAPRTYRERFAGPSA